MRFTTSPYMGESKVFFSYIFADTEAQNELTRRMEVNERKINRMVLYEVALDVKLQALFIVLSTPRVRPALRIVFVRDKHGPTYGTSQGEGWIRQAEEVKHAQWPVERID